jgi:hypothetical protein
MTFVADTIFFMAIGRGPGFGILLMAFIFIFFMDKIVKVIAYLGDKIQERRKRKK